MVNRQRRPSIHHSPFTIYQLLSSFGRPDGEFDDDFEAAPFGAGERHGPAEGVYQAARDGEPQLGHAGGLLARRVYVDGLEDAGHVMDGLAAVLDDDL